MSRLASVILPLHPLGWVVSVKSCNPHITQCSGCEQNRTMQCTENAHVDLKHKYCERKPVILCYEILAFVMMLGDSSVGRLEEELTGFWASERILCLSRWPGLKIVTGKFQSGMELGKHLLKPVFSFLTIYSFSLPLCVLKASFKLFDCGKRIHIFVDWNES